MPHVDDPRPLDMELLRRWPLPVDSDGDKFTRGTVLVVGGSASTPGAPILAARAALRMGAGRVQIATPGSAAPHIAVTVPESKVIALDDSRGARAELREPMSCAQCVLLGPGLTDGDLTATVVRAAFEVAADDAVLVLDAAGLTQLGQVEQTLVERRRGRLVLTPNRQELAELLAAGGQPVAGDDLDHGAAVALAAHRWGAVVSSFGTVRSWTGEGWRTDVGHPGLGTSGSGDVLAGLVAGVAARTREPAQAACWGTLAHAMAGEALGRANGAAGFLAGELIDAVTGLLPDPPDR